MVATAIEQPAAVLNSPRRIINVPDFSYIRRVTSDLLVANGITEPPVDAYVIAQNCGVRVTYVEFMDEHKGIAGLIECDGKDIAINSEMTDEQCNYAIAHELGHSVLGHEICGESQEYSFLYRDLLRQKQTHMLQEARFFAMHLLMPDAMLCDYLENFPFATDEQLADIFDVPVEILKLRRQYF